MSGRIRLELDRTEHGVPVWVAAAGYEGDNGVFAADFDAMDPDPLMAMTLLAEDVYGYVYKGPPKAAPVPPEGIREVAESIAQAIEVSQGDRCPECNGKSASVKWGRGGTGAFTRHGRCGAGHTWTVSSWSQPAEVARQWAARWMRDVST